MLRQLLQLSVLVVFALCALTAHADLEIIRSWATVDNYWPDGICYDSVRGTLWVTHHAYTLYDDRIIEYTRTGVAQQWFSTSSLGVDNPRGLEFHEATEYTWVVDRQAPMEVVRYNRDFEVVHRFSLSNMSSAVGIAFNTNDGRLYLCDTIGSKILKWTVGGFYQGVWVTLPFSPNYICYLENEGKFLVSETQKIHKITSGGLIQQTYNLFELFGINCIEGLSHDPVAGTVFVVQAQADHELVHEIAGFTTYTGVADTAETQASWSAIKALYR